MMNANPTGAKETVYLCDGVSKEETKTGQHDPAVTAPPLSKMTEGSDGLRDHDFPMPEGVVPLNSGPVALPSNAPSPEGGFSGGKPGTMSGDVQKVGEVNTIVNQDAIQPDFHAEVE